MANGKLKFVKSAACSNGPPKGGVWFPLSVTVNGQDAQVYHSGVLVAITKPHFPPKAWGGVFAYNGDARDANAWLTCQDTLKWMLPTEFGRRMASVK